MARRRSTLRNLPTLARRVARLADELGSLKRRLDRLIPEVASASMAESALLRADSMDKIVLTDKGMEVTNGSPS